MYLISMHVAVVTYDIFALIYPFFNYILFKYSNKLCTSFALYSLIHYFPSSDES